MHRFLIAAASAALVAAIAAPAFAEDSYPPCTQPGQDHCRVVPMHHAAMGHHHHGKMGHHHGKMGHHHGAMHHHGGHHHHGAAAGGGDKH